MMTTIEEAFAVAHQGHVSPGEGYLACTKCDDNRALAESVLEDTRPNIRARIAALGRK